MRASSHAEFQPTNIVIIIAIVSIELSKMSKTTMEIVIIKRL